MSPAEIYAEIMRDMEVLSRKSHAQAILFQNEMRRKGLKRELRSVQYETAAHNMWTLQFIVFPDKIAKAYYLLTQDEIGQVVYMLNFHDGVRHEVMKFNSHFLKRYRERAHPELEKTKDLVKYFFSHNSEWKWGETEDMEDGSSLLSLAYPEGLAIGWHLAENKFAHIKTFLTHDMLSESQQGLVDFIKSQNDDDEFNTVLNPKHLKNKF
jgi:hypothetical protein